MDTLVLSRINAYCVLAFSIALIAIRANAQQNLPLKVEDSFGTAFLEGSGPTMALSADGKWVAYVVHQPQCFADRHTCNPTNASVDDIYVTRTDTGETRTLTGHIGSNVNPIWSPNSDFLAFLSTRDAPSGSRLWVWELKENRVRQVSDVSIGPVGGAQVQWFPDGRRLMVPAFDERTPADSVANPSTTYSSGTDSLSNSPTVVLYSSRPRTGPQTGLWSLDAAARSLLVIDVASGSVQASIKGYRVAQFALSPDGQSVAIVNQERFERPASTSILSSLVLAEISGDNTVYIALSEMYFEGQVSWSPDSTKLAVMVSKGRRSTQKCYVIDRRAAIYPRNLIEGSGRSSDAKVDDGPLWDSTMRSIYFLRGGELWKVASSGGVLERAAAVPKHDILGVVDQRQGTLNSAEKTLVLARDHAKKQSGFWRVDLATGAAKMLKKDDRCYVCVSTPNPALMSNDGQLIVYFAEDSQHSPDLWISDSNWGDNRRLSHINPNLDSYRFGTQQKIRWAGRHGDSIAGLLLLPSNYRNGEKYPLVVLVYGGRRLSDDWASFFGPPSFFGNLQLLSTRGYAVLLPDAPQRMGTPMLDLAQTILPGVEKVIKMGIADPDRLGVMGHSYGGYSVLSLLVQTKIFKAAVAGDGFGDLTAAYGELDDVGRAFQTAMMETGQGLMGGPPWSLEQRYVRNSPIYYLDRVSTPLLLFHGGSDRAVLPFLSGEIFVGLRRLNRDVEYALYTGEGHSPIYWKSPNQFDLCKRILDWFDAHLEAQKAVH